MINHELATAAQIYTAATVCPFQPAEVAADAQYPLDPQKARHYGVMARVVIQSIDTYLTDPSRQALLPFAESNEELSLLLRHGLATACVDTGLTGAQDDEWAYLDKSQLERNKLVPQRGDDAESALIRGIDNFANLSMPYLYQSLDLLYGVEVACKPDDWHLLFKLASLGAEQLNVFGTYFFLKNPKALHGIITQSTLEDGSTRLRFIEGFPEGVKISSNYDPQDLTAPGEQTYDLRDVKGTGPHIGCPIILKAKQVEALWNIYVQQRHRIDTV